MTILLTILIGVLLVSGGFLLFEGILWGLMFMSVGTGMLFGFKKIPADPPNIGLVTFWGKRTGDIKSEGWTLLAPYFPFLYGVILVDMTKKNKDYTFQKVRCIVSENVKTDSEESQNIRSGGSVEVVTSLTWIPDAYRLIAYSNSGMQAGVEQIITDKMAEVIRQMGRTNTWEEMTFATEVMSANLVIAIVGTDITDANDNPWRWGEAISRGTALQRDDVTEALKFLASALKNGVADDHDLGIKIQRLNIKSVEPEGELKKDAEKSAQEVQQRRAEDFELETEIIQAKKLGAHYAEMETPRTPEECLLEIRRRKGIKDGKGQVIDIAGLSPEILTAATRLLGR